jgi:NAD(P)H-dependent FMN reductase
MTLIVGVSGAVGPTKRTTQLVELALNALRDGGHETDLLDLRDYDLAWCDGRDPSTYDQVTVDAIERIARCHGCIVATPVYRASFSARLKNLFDLLPADVLKHKPVGLIAAGGSLEHRLAIDYALRPLLGQFGALVVPDVIYSVPEDFVNGAPAPELNARIATLVGVLSRVIQALAATPLSDNRTGPDNLA